MLSESHAKLARYLRDRITKADLGHDRQEWFDTTKYLSSHLDGLTNEDRSSFLRTCGLAKPESIKWIP